MTSFVIDLLEKTAWSSDTPKPYSVFHIVFSAVGIAVAAGTAYGLARLVRRGASCGSAGPESPSAIRKTGRTAAAASPLAFAVLFSCGLILALGELYKQLFLYCFVYNGRYEWWYFPFQLCSIPMYLCLLLPLFRRSEGLRAVLCAFLQDYGLLGGVMALAEPSGLLHPYWSLTIHGLLWHIILIFISLFIAFSGLSDRTGKGFIRTLPLLALFCLIATAINVATHGAADMFYISPYYPITQAVFHSIALRFGNAVGIGTYLACLCAGGYLCHRFAEWLHARAGITD